MGERGGEGGHLRTPVTVPLPSYSPRYAPPEHDLKDRRDQSAI